MFLWDVLEAIPDRIKIDEIIVSLRPTIRSVFEQIKQIKAAARHAHVVHAQFGSLVGMLASFTSRPFVLSLRGTDFYVMPSTTVLGRIDARLRQVLTYIACLRADVIVVMSRRMRRELRRWPLMKRRRIVVMTDPIGDEFLDKDITRQLNLKKGRPLTIFIGSLSASNPIKRVWLIQKAADICNRAGIPVELNVISGMPRQAVKEAMRKSDVMALASTHEGWPNIVKEGQALGLPFIATDVSDLAELCFPGSPNRLVEADELDIALAIVDAFAFRETQKTESSIFPQVVALKHEVMYEFVSPGEST